MNCQVHLPQGKEILTISAQLSVIRRVKIQRQSTTDCAILRGKKLRSAGHVSIKYAPHFHLASEHIPERSTKDALL
jgi:hypothetical protein